MGRFDKGQIMTFSKPKPSEETYLEALSRPFSGISTALRTLQRYSTVSNLSVVCFCSPAFCAPLSPLLSASGTEKAREKAEK
jgi:hypothetical protein